MKRLSLLIDVDTYMTYVFDMSRITQAGRGAATVYLSQDNAKKTLETGVTAVRNLGASDSAGRSTISTSSFRRFAG